MPHTKSVFLVKGSRLSHTHPILNSEVVERNALVGFDTTLMFDLNILSNMQMVLKTERSLSETGLQGVIDILNQTRGLHLMPGMGLAEASDQHIANLSQSFEEFLRVYCPTCGDTPQTKRDHLLQSVVLGRPKSYMELSEGHRIGIGHHYLSMLKVRQLDKRQDLRAYEKFVRYVDFFCDEVDVFGGLGTEVAKYVFFNVASADEEDFRDHCKTIKENFRKPTGSHEKLLRVCMNSAFDLFYYGLSSHIPAFELDGRKQDLWLLTGDEGLARLTDSIFYFGNFLGGGMSAAGNIPHRNKYEYFVDCDELVADRSQARVLKGKLPSDPIAMASRIHESVLKLEKDARALFNRPDGALSLQPSSSLTDS